MPVQLNSENQTIVPLFVHERFRPLLACNDVLYGGRGQNLYRRESNGKLVLVCDLGTPLMSQLSKIWFVERVLRADIHTMTCRQDGNRLLAVKGSVRCFDSGSGSEVGRFDIPGGTRPLRIENSPDGMSWFGEYSVNSNREAVPVYASADGVRWDVAYRFPKSSIRHIHGIFYDSFRKGLWVLTGDDGDEAGLWFTDDGFSHLTPVARGSQACRAVTIFTVESGLIVPTDTPQQANRIAHFDIENGRFEELAELPGSSLASTWDGNCMLVSTAVERSKVNKDQRVSVFASIDGLRWKCVTALNRDWPIMKNMRPYLQHPNIRFATGDGSSDRIYASCIAVKGYDGRMISWRRSDIENYLKEVS